RAATRPPRPARAPTRAALRSRHRYARSRRRPPRPARLARDPATTRAQPRPQAAAASRRARAASCSDTLEFRALVGGAEAPLVVERHARHRAAGVVREEQLHAAFELVLEEGAFLVDQKFRVAVVAHRDR